MQNNYNNRDVEYAGFWVRLAAYCIDSLIVFAGLLVVRLFMAGVSSLAKGTVLDGGILFQYTLKDIVLYVFEVLYFILCTYYTGTTLGKKALNLRVVSALNGQKLSLLDVVYRETIGRFLCSISIGIGYVIVGIDKEKRGIHDMLCDTRVIYGKKIKVYPVYQVPKMPQVPPVPPMTGQPPMAGQPPMGQPPMGQPPQNNSYHMVHPEDEQK